MNRIVILKSDFSNLLILALQRNSKLTVKILMSVVLRERIHLGFHGFVACEAMNFSAKSMMIIYRMISISVV